jgi:hypothetical protein
MWSLLRKIKLVLPCPWVMLGDFKECTCGKMNIMQGEGVKDKCYISEKQYSFV